MSSCLKRFTPAALALASVLSLSACSTSSPDSYKRSEAQTASTVQDAVVLSVRDVTIEGSQSGVGAATGGIVGAVAGSTVGGKREAVIAGTLAAVGGAVVGNLVEKASTKEAADEILLQMADSKQRRVIVQAKGSQTFKPGDAVIVVSSGGKLRVMKPAAH